MSETEVKNNFFRKAKRRFPGCEIIRGDSSSQQGMPDDFLLWGPFWAAFEFKVSARARKHPNQEYYITKLDEMSFAAFVYPENEDEVLDALEQAFESSRRACVS